MIDWKKRRVSRVRLYKLFDLVDKNVADAGVRRLMKNKIMEILYLPMNPKTKEQNEDDDSTENAKDKQDYAKRTEIEIARARLFKDNPEDDENALFEEFSSFSICGL